MNPVKMTLIISVTLTLCDYLLGACIYVSISIYSLSYYRVFFFYYFLCLFARESEGAQAVGAAGEQGACTIASVKRNMLLLASPCYG